MKRRTVIKGLGAAVSALALSEFSKASGFLEPPVSGESIAKGPFQPTWNSLAQYQVPDWFRDAKFGIWAHWGPQCQPEHGDWYARGMYEEGSGHYEYHVKKYGHPSK